MSFNKVAITGRNKYGWVKLLGQERTMSNWRLLGSAGSILLGLTLLYCSVFYVPAYFNYQQAFGITGVSPISKAGNKQSFVQPLVDLLNLNRAFLREDQGMEAAYSFPKGTKGEVVFYQCQSPAVLEVFKCDGAIIKRFPIGRKLSGKEGLQVSVAGFYGFDVILEDPDIDYQLVWRRRY